MTSGHQGVGGPLRAVLSDSIGSIIVSAVLGLGLAIVFFWRVCRGDSCVIVRSGAEQEEQERRQQQDRLYRVQGDACYRYVPYDVPCPGGGGAGDGDGEGGGP